jgi:hypothetical protein
LTVAEWIGWIALVWWVLMLAPVWYGLLVRRRLVDVPPLPGSAENLPWVSIIVPARDEGDHIESALRAMLSIDYPRLEVIAVDDRSTDGTGAAMDEVAGADPRCRVIHVRDLPAGWLGKNHANWLGARAAQGEYLLFTDGDVKMRPEILRHAMAHMLARRLDHLTLQPDTGKGAFWESVLLTYFILSFGVFTRASLARFRWARGAHVGIGAFNLVRRTAYEAIGTHERLRLEVADDVMLGKLLKQSGGRPDVLDGKPLLYVKWQTGVWGIIRGLEKNAFAGTRYSLPLTTAGVAFQLFVISVPFVLAVTGPAQIAWALFSGLSLVTYAGVAVRADHSPLVVLFFPVGGLLFAYTVARSAYVTLRDGGVRWRDTFYPLAELKRGMV